MKDGGLQTVGPIDLRDGEGKIVGILVYQIPCIGPEPVLDVPDESRGAEKGDPAVSPQAKTDKMIEPDEMVHMGVGNEDVIDFHYLSGGQGMEIAKVKQNGLTPVLEFQKHSGVVDRAINQTGII